MSKPNVIKYLNLAVKLAGGRKSDLARAMGVTRACVNGWYIRKRVGHKAAKKMEAVFDGKIKRTDVTDFFD